jgi:hypothetical protein
MPAPPASDGSADDPGCFCAAAPGAALQAKAEDGRSGHGFAFLAPVQQPLGAPGAVQRQPVCRLASFALATHQHRNPPLLI